MNKRPDPRAGAGKGKPFIKRPGKPAPAAAKPAVSKNSDLLFGLHAVKAAMANPQRSLKQIIVTEAAQREIADLRQDHHPKVTLYDKAELERLLPKGAVHQGVAVVAEKLPEIFLTDLIIAAQSRAKTVLVMLDEVTDPHNIGAILRSMAAFGAHGLVSHRYNSPGITGTLAKTATGALEHVPMAEVTNLARSLHELQEAGFLTVGCDERATHAINHLPQSDKVVLVLGAEGKGLRPSTRAQCQVIASIPTTGPIASLNVSNAAAIALFCLQ
jgi:23S rRNA (guanosine2251-2'-O)-methyltransferase